jgi:hypothetical protein
MATQRFRPYVGPKGSINSVGPHEPDPPEGDAPLPTYGDEREGAGGPLMVPDGAPGLTEHSMGGHREASEPEGRVLYADDGPDDEEDDRGQAAEDEDEEDELPDFYERGKTAFQVSTDYMDSNFRRPLEDSLRAFNSQHPSDSKYNSETFKKRSNLFRPITRSVISKNEAALCAALFSNLDLIECAAANPGEKEEIVSAEVMQALIQERLTVSIPWFQISIGGFQDAMVQGIVIGKSGWCRTSRGSGHKYQIVKDQPDMQLVAAENFRFDPSASWFDVVNTSPYLIELMPVYIGEVKERMSRHDAKGRKWKYLDDETLKACIDVTDESTRAARTNLSQDASAVPRIVSDYDLVWVHRHIHRWRSEDYEFYMLASKYMLTDPEPLRDSVWFGERPYVVGTCVIETHKPIPSSVPTMTRDLQSEANDVQNQRSDNVKFALNKAHLVKRSANVDVNSLVRNVPGRVTMVNDVDKDVRELEWKDVTASAYEEQSRIDADFNAIAGNFNPMQLSQTRNPRESYRTVSAVQSPAMMMTEYRLMTYVQTFLLPWLRQLVLLEQYYENDETMLAIAGQKAQIAKKFGVNQVTDSVLEKRMSVNVNLGMGATDPNTKQERFDRALMTYANLCKAAPPGLDLEEVRKELLALAGYRDGQRFSTQQDAEKQKLLQTVKALTDKIRELTITKHDRHESNVVKLVTSREGNQTKLLLAGKEDEHQSRHLMVGHLMEMEKQDKAHEQALTQGAQQGAQAEHLQAQKPPPAAPGAA